MRIFVCGELMKNLKVNIEKIEEAYKQANDKNYEAFFIYTFALFESAVCESMRHILIAFPEKIPSEKYPKLKLKDIYSNISSPQYILYTLVNAEIKSIRKGDVKFLLDEAKDICSIELKYNEESLDNISSERNKLTHDNTISNQQYILGEGYSNTSNFFNVDKCRKNIMFLLDILRDFSSKLELKYQKYTKFKLVKELWESVFDTPLLRFEDCIVIRNWAFENNNKKVVGFNFEHIKSVSKSISSGEKFYLAILLQQYSCSANDQFFKFNDIPALVSVSSKYLLNDILQVFSVYPNLFNGMNIDGSDLNENILMNTPC